MGDVLLMLDHIVLMLDLAAGDVPLMLDHILLMLDLAAWGMSY